SRGEPPRAHNRPALNSGRGWGGVRWGHAQRFALGVTVLALLWTGFNAGYLMPQTDWFRPQRAPDDPLGMATRTDMRFASPGGDALELVGYTLQNAQARPGKSLAMTLYWRALGPLSGIPSADFTLATRDYTTIYGGQGGVPLANIPFAVWDPARYAVQQINIPLVDDLPPYPGVLRVRLWGAEGTWRTSDGNPEPILLTVPSAGAGQATIPREAEGLDARFGESITLAALALEPTASGARFQLFWDVRRAPGADYTLFVHFLDANDAYIGGADRPPLGINYPTREWRAGERLVSDLHLALPDGARTIALGLYDAQTGARLPLEADAPHTDNALRLTIP
ncbi:MAG: hypothetical protein ACLFTK_10630, partial [Anaerolineales bacterium]